MGKIFLRSCPKCKYELYATINKDGNLVYNNCNGILYTAHVIDGNVYVEELVMDSKLRK